MGDFNARTGTLNDFIELDETCDSDNNLLPPDYTADIVRNNTVTFVNEPRQANLCLRAFRHDKFQLRMPSHSEGLGIWLSV